MSYYHEFEYVFDELMDAGLGYSLVANSGSAILGIVSYVLMALALYTLAERRGIKNPWLSWIPVVNCWIIGSLSDQYRYVVKGEVKNKRKILLILNIVTWILSVAMIVALIVMAVNAFSAAMNGAPEEAILEIVMGPVMIILGFSIPMAGVGIATAVIHYMAMYDIYTSCTPKNNVIFLVLGILFSVTESFFLFFTRNKDEGMPPRKQEPVYTPPQEPWENPEYL